MATTTTNYGWDIPQSTDLVKDGATAIALLGQDIDTSMNTALAGKKAGMVLLNTTSFSGVSSQSVNNVFSSTYKNYRIFINLTAITVDGSSNIKLRVGGVDAATAYNYNGLQVSTSTATGDSQTAQTSFPVMQMDSAASGAYHVYIADLFNPFEAVQTGIIFTSRSFTGSGAPLFWNYGGYHGTSSSYDGFTLTLTGSTTGTIKVYGYND
jgi:hypothetical protein